MTTPVPERLSDQAARDRIRCDLDTTLIVEAAAGTGKTSELVQRMIAVLMAGRTRLDRIVAVTFTDAAAGELKLRLRGAIERARQDPECPDASRLLLNQALPQLEEARIGTIHSFCSDLLRRRPVEAGVDPLFEVAPGDVASALFDRAFDRWFETQLASPGEGVRRILRRRAGREGPRVLLKAAAWSLAERRDFPARWRAGDGFRREAMIDSVMDEMAALAGWAAAGDVTDYFTRSLLEIKRFYDEVTRKEGIRGRDYDGLEAQLIQTPNKWHWDWVGYKRVSDNFPKAELLERRAALKQRLDAFKAAAGADLAPRLRDELWSVVEAYEHLKERAGCMDFLDLLLRARDLVREDATVRGELQQEFTHIFVDEFQDTDPLQAEILVLLSGSDASEHDWRRVKPAPGKLFVVGDPKQSIYRFRRADVALYEAVKRQVMASGGALVELTVSFRAVPEIQETVNAAFAPLIRGQSLSQASYVPLANHRSGVATQPAIIALPVPAPYGDYGRIINQRIEESLPDVIAGFVEWLVNSSGWTVTERERPAVRVPIQPRHICLLFRRFKHFITDVTRPYVRALEARHLPHLLVGGSSFHAREEVEAIRNALSAIEWPEDELAVFATLHGPLFALGDSALLSFRERYSTLHPYREVPDDQPEELREVAEALAVLRELHRGRNHRPIADTIGRLLEATRAHAGLAIWPTGEQALANVARMMDMARRVERTGITSFRGFVDWLIDESETGEASDAPIIEEGTEGVRIMTVHKAKGLEFPVVMLADMTARDVPRDPSRWVDSARGLCAIRIAGCAPPELWEHAPEEMQLEAEEAVRVLYVAATRARDLLVVPAIGDEKRDGWVSALNPVIYPPPERARRPETSAPPGCPSFGDDSAPLRARNATRPNDSIAPGLHRPEVGNHMVVWFDPAVLRLGAQESVGLTQQKLLVADEAGIRSEAGIRAHAEWQTQRTLVRMQGATPGLKVVTATEHAAVIPSDMPGLPTVEVERMEFEGVRPHGRRFGILVHAVLSVVHLAASRSDVDAAAELQGRILGAEPDEIAAASQTVAHALSHRLMKRAAAALDQGKCRREVPVAMTLEDGLLLEGVVDLAFIEEEPTRSWVVVDFKTDIEIAGRLQEYKNQLGLYAMAISRATRVPARGILLQI